MGDFFHSSVGGSLALGIPIALITGLISFFSPCVLPLLPGYLSYTTGLSGADIASGNVKRGRMLAGALLFVLGFTIVFVLVGVAGGTFGAWLATHARTFSIILGVVTIVLGLAYLGLIPALQRDVRVHKVPAVGLPAAPLLGFLFAIGWTPCMGPTLGVMFNLAYNEGTAARGGLLLAVYSIGLGIPFILFALMWRRALGTLGFIRKNIKWVTRIGGVMFILIGIALLTGWWDYGVQWIQQNLVDSWSVTV